MLHKWEKDFCTKINDDEVLCQLSCAKCHRWGRLTVQSWLPFPLICSFFGRWQSDTPRWGFCDGKTDWMNIHKRNVQNEWQLMGKRQNNADDKKFKFNPPKDITSAEYEGYWMRILADIKPEQENWGAMLTLALLALRVPGSNPPVRGIDIVVEGLLQQAKERLHEAVEEKMDVTIHPKHRGVTAIEIGWK